MKIANFKDLMGDHKSAEIIDIVNKAVVRRLSVNGKETVHVDAITVSVDVPIDTELHYETWTLDRGDLLFWNNTHPEVWEDVEMKLCTEMDKIRYPDGSEHNLYPADSLVKENPIFKESK